MSRQLRVGDLVRDWWYSGDLGVVLAAGYVDGVPRRKLVLMLAFNDGMDDRSGIVCSTDLLANEHLFLPSENG